MRTIPALRWGEPYSSMEVDEVVHFETGEPVARISAVNAGIVQRDLRKAARAREALRQFSIAELLAKMSQAADLYRDGTLMVGDAPQSPEQFVRDQSATTGLPETLCRANMTKNHFVLNEMPRIFECLTRGLDLEVLSRGHGVERGVPISYQAQASAVGLVLPSNSPGVHTLWLPIIPMQIGLVLKPGSSEPWTPFRVAAAFAEAGVPREAISIYPGRTDVGGAILGGCERSMIFGSAQTVEQYKGNPRVQVHGPGFSKILLGEDVVDHWPDYLDLMIESIAANSGRGCINCSAIFAPRHGEAIAEAIAERLVRIEPLPPADPKCELAAFTIPGAAEAISNAIDADTRLPGVTEVTAKLRGGPRWIPKGRYDFLLPTLLHVRSSESPAANKEYMFPYAAVVDCPQEEMIGRIGPTLVCTAITREEKFRRQLLDAVHIDRLNLGAVPTHRINWLQPHEGNIVEFLFRSRAFQVAE